MQMLYSATSQCFLTTTWYRCKDDIVQTCCIAVEMSCCVVLLQLQYIQVHARTAFPLEESQQGKGNKGFDSIQLFAPSPLLIAFMLRRRRMTNRRRCLAPTKCYEALVTILRRKNGALRNLPVRTTVRYARKNTGAKEESDRLPITQSFLVCSTMGKCHDLQVDLPPW